MFSRGEFRELCLSAGNAGSPPPVAGPAPTGTALRYRTTPDHDSTHIRSLYKVLGGRQLTCTVYTIPECARCLI